MTVAAEDFGHLALFGPRGIAFSIDSTEDADSVTRHLALLSEATHAIVRLLNEDEDRCEEEIATLMASARPGIEFLTGFCASLAKDLSLRADESRERE